MGIETLAAASLASSAGSSIIGAAGALFSGFSSYQQGQYQAAVARNNAELARRAQEAAILEGQSKAFQTDMKTRALLGEQLAQQGGSGFDVNEGSPLRIRESTAELGRLDAQMQDFAGREKAYGFEIEKNNFLAQSKLASQKGKLGLVSGIIGAGSSLISGGGQVADKWFTFKQKGINPGGFF